MNFKQALLIVVCALIISDIAVRLADDPPTKVVQFKDVHALMVQTVRDDPSRNFAHYHIEIDYGARLKDDGNVEFAGEQRMRSNHR